MIKDAEKQHVVKLPGKGIDVIQAELLKVDIKIKSLRRKARLAEVAIINIDSQHTSCTPLLQGNGVETCVASDVEDARAIEIMRKCLGNVLPLHLRIVAEKMPGR